MVKTLFKEELKTGAFTIDFSKINECKGLVYIEVKPLKYDQTLILNNSESDLINSSTPFKLRSEHPIVNGLLTFEPFRDNPKKMKSVVRMLLIE